MNRYVVTVFSYDKENKPKEKSVVCNSDVDMFAIVQDCQNNDLTYEVHKAELTLVLSNKEIVTMSKK